MASALIVVSCFVFACYCMGGATLASLLRGDSRTKVDDFYFTNRYHIRDIDVVGHDDVLYLTEQFRTAKPFKKSGETGLTFECRVDFYPCGRGWCRVSPYMDRNALKVKVFMNAFASDEEWFIVDLAEPMPKGIRSVLDVLRRASENRAQSTATK